MKLSRWALAAVFLAVGLGLMQESRGASIQPNQSGTPNGSFETTVITSSTANVTGFSSREGVLYGFKLLATSANATCQLSDTTTFGVAGGTGNGTMTQGVFIDEGGEATQWDTYESIWPLPYSLQTGLTVVIANGNVTIYHDVR